MSTIKQVAELTGLSVSCVSKYLNHPNNVLPETKAKIDKAIKTLNYCPSPIARSLRTKRTGIIVIVTESIINPFFAELFDSLRHEFQKIGYKAILKTLSGQKFSSEDFSFADGIVICFPNDESNISKIEMVSQNIPKILIHGRKIDTYNNIVYCDIGNGSKLAAEHLYNKGCRKFLLVCGLNNSSMSNKKSNAVLSFLESTKEETTCFSIYGSNDYYGGEKAITTIVDSLKNIDGIICESDALATGVISKLLSLNVSIPDDIKIVGFDNIPIAHMFHPALTTIAIPIKEMCIETVTQTARILNDKEVSFASFNPQLIIRQTT